MDIGPYRVERKLEKHGEAVVCAARHLETDEAILLTAIPASVAQGEARIQAAAGLSHQNILPIMDSGRAGNVFYAAVPVLQPVLVHDRRLSPNAAAALVRQVAAALDYAHQQGIVHGHLHRLHILRRMDNKAATQILVRGFELGAGDDDLSPATDITALGGIFYRAITGQDMPDGDLPPTFPVPLANVLGQDFATARAFSSALTAAVALLPDSQRISIWDGTRAVPTRQLRPPAQRQPEKQQPRLAPRRRTSFLRIVGLMILAFVIITIIGEAALLAINASHDSGSGTQATPNVIVLVITATSTTAAVAPTEAHDSANPTGLAPATVPATGPANVAPTVPATTSPVSPTVPADTATVLPTATASPSPRPTDQPSSTPSHTPSATLAPTITLTATPLPTQTHLPSPTLAPSAPPTALPIMTPNATVPDGDGAVMRTGPGLLYFDLTTIEPGTLLIAEERSPDNLWIKVRYQQSEGWVTIESLKLNVDASTLLPATDQEIAAIPLTRRCVSVVGDSVTHGGVTFEVPATGYIIALTVPLAIYIEQQFRAVGITDVNVLDRGVSHTGISTANHPSYFKTPTYQKLLTDRCEYTIVMPWINDITPGIPREEAFPAHLRALSSLVGDVLARDPGGRVLLLNYYQGAVAQFALDTWAAGFTLDNITYYNDQLAAACKDGVFSTIVQVTCIGAQPAFEGMGISYVIGPISQKGFYDLLISDLNPKYKIWLDTYAAASPDGLLFGDGVHLSPPGKTALATYLVKLIQASDVHF